MKNDLYSKSVTVWMWLFGLIITTVVLSVVAIFVGATVWIWKLALNT